MKRLIVVLMSFLCLTGCVGDKNVDVGKKGIICLPNGEVVEGEIESLTRWSDACFEVTIDGVEYAVHPVALAVVKEDTDG